MTNGFLGTLFTLFFWINCIAKICSRSTKDLLSYVVEDSRNIFLQEIFFKNGFIQK